MKKLRIATYFENRLGRSDGAPLYYSQVLKRMGHEVVHFTSEDTGDLDKWGEFDIHLHADWGEDGLVNLLPYKPMDCPHPSIYIPCDSHITEAGRDFRFNLALKHDWNFFCHSRGMEEFKKLHPDKHADWLPCAVEPLAYPNTPVSLKTYDIGFVGFVTFRKRAEMLDRMFKEFPNFFYGQRFSRWIYGEPAGGQDTADIFRKSKIVFNTAAVDDFNMRIPESTATGSFLLTEWVPDIEKAGYVDGVHLVTYKTMDEAIEKAHYYLENEQERELIAKTGMEFTLANHTYKHRAEKILSTIFGDKNGTS